MFQTTLGEAENWMNQMMPFLIYPLFSLGTDKMASVKRGSSWVRGAPGLDPAMQFKDQGEPQGHVPTSLRKYLGLTSFTYTSSLNLFSDISV